MLVLAASVVCATAYSACRDCAQSPFGGPQENRFTAYDPIATGRDPGLPQIYVNLANLTLFVRVNDLPFGGPAPGFSLERSYNSDDTRSGPFGAGWSFVPGDSLTVTSDGSLVLRRASGRIDQFASSPAGTIYAVTATTDSLSQNSDGTYTLRAAGSATVRVFSASGALMAIQDGSVTRVSLEYDSSNRLTTARYRGRALTFQYDAGGRINSVSDAAGRTVNYSYTGDGRLQQQTNADGTTVQYQYDDAGRLTALAYRGSTIGITYGSDSGNAWVASITTPDATRQYDTMLSPSQVRVRAGDGNTWIYQSSAAGLLQSVTDPYGNSVSYSYDSAGRRTQATNGAGETAAFTYDARGRLTGVTDAAKSQWQADYNTAGLLSHVTDPRGNVWTFLYDTAGNLVGTKNAEGGSTSAAVSATGQITAVTDPLGQKSLYEYNSDGLLKKWVDPSGGSWTYDYDAAARTVARTDPANGTLQASYDVGVRPAALGSGDTNVPVTSQAANRDWANRLTDYTDGYGNRISYTYGAGGKLAAMTMPGNKTVSYEYDKAGRLSKVTDWLGNFAIYRYDAAGYPVSATVAGGPATIYQYDPARRLRAVVSAGPDGSPVAGYRYTFDQYGNRIALNALEPGAAQGAVSAVTTNYNATNLPVSRSDGQTYRYDAKGNLTSIQGTPNLGFTYDAFGRLSAVQSDSSTSYGYDASGLRSIRTGAAGERHFVYDISAVPRLVVETTGDNTPVAWYVYGLGLLWKVTAGDSTYFYHLDGDGNVVAVSSTAKGVVNQYRYDAWGRLVSSNETVENALRSHGAQGWIDDGNGLIYTTQGYWFGDIRLTLPSTADPAPPEPTVTPSFLGAGACFIEGVAACRFGNPGGQR